MWRWKVKAFVAIAVFGFAGGSLTSASFAKMLPTPDECALLQESEKSMPSPSTPSPVANTVRDPEIAVCEEFEIAAQQGTVEAYRFFIARHPQHQLAELAKARIGEQLSD